MTSGNYNVDIELVIILPKPARIYHSWIIETLAIQ